MTFAGVIDGPDPNDKSQLSYLDLMERSSNVEEKRQRERLIMDEGLQLWKSKRNEEQEQDYRDKQQVPFYSKLLWRFERVQANFKALEEE